MSTQQIGSIAQNIVREVGQKCLVNRLDRISAALSAGDVTEAQRLVADARELAATMRRLCE